MNKIDFFPKHLYLESEKILLYRNKLLKENKRLKRKELLWSLMMAKKFIPLIVGWILVLFANSKIVIGVGLFTILSSLYYIFFKKKPKLKHSSSSDSLMDYLKLKEKQNNEQLIEINVLLKALSHFNTLPDKPTIAQKSIYTIYCSLSKHSNYFVNTKAVFFLEKFFELWNAEKRDSLYLDSFLAYLERNQEIFETAAKIIERDEERIRSLLSRQGYILEDDFSELKAVLNPIAEDIVSELSSLESNLSKVVTSLSLEGVSLSKSGEVNLLLFSSFDSFLNNLELYILQREFYVKEKRLDNVFFGGSYSKRTSIEELKKLFYSLSSFRSNISLELNNLVFLNYFHSIHSTLNYLNSKLSVLNEVENPSCLSQVKEDSGSRNFRQIYLSAYSIASDTLILNEMVHVSNVICEFLKKESLFFEDDSEKVLRLIREKNEKKEGVSID